MKPAAQLQILVDALVATGWRLWRTSHSNTPAAQLVYRWMRDIAPGHFVLEISSLITGKRARDRIGDLLSITVDGGGRAYKIRTIAGREFRWTNASFVRIPRSDADNREIFLLGESAAPAEPAEPCGHKYTAGFCRFCGNPDPRSA